MPIKYWKNVGVDFARLFAREPARREVSPREEGSLFERLGVEFSHVFSDYRPTTPSQPFIAREVAFTDYLSGKEPTLKDMGHYLPFLFSDQTYRWN